MKFDNFWNGVRIDNAKIATLVRIENVKIATLPLINEIDSNDTKIY